MNVETRLFVVDENRGIANLSKSYYDTKGRLRKHVWTHYNSTDAEMEIIYDRNARVLKTINYDTEGNIKSVQRHPFRILADKLVSIFKS